MKNTIDQCFTSALAWFNADFGRGYQARLSELTEIGSSQLNDVLKGRKGLPEEKRRSVVQANTKLNNINFDYDEFLYFGDWLLSATNPYGFKEQINECIYVGENFLFHLNIPFSVCSTAQKIDWIDTKISSTSKKLKETSSTTTLTDHYAPELDKLTNHQLKLIGKTKPPVKKLQGQLLALELTKHFIINGVWVYVPHGPTDVPAGSPSPLGARIIGPGENGLIQDFTSVPTYKARLSGGNGSFEREDQIEANLMFRTEFLQKKGQVNKMALFEVTGESMVPFIHDTDVVLVDRSINTLEQIIDGKAFAYREGDTVKVKRLSRQGNKLIASNENYAIYPPYEIDTDNFQIIGRVVWVGHEVN